MKKRTAERWFQEYFTKGNQDILDELTEEDFVFHSRNGGHSREKMKEFMEWYRSIFHDDEWVMDDLIEQGDKLVVRYTGWMTYKGGGLISLLKTSALWKRESKSFNSLVKKLRSYGAKTAMRQFYLN
ncbi:ester cyclase [Mesobacillus zeae]|uniref:ester cyclase n=1 Tax=Mesobacillus zeae TaxID=1917180 RepID=UPI0015E6FBC7|nr:nuclear transport factor 2 family protein [Mesobacillus zeae]